LENNVVRSRFHLVLPWFNICMRDEARRRVFRSMGDWGPELSSQSELRLARIAAMGALVAALGVAGCGRKGGLEPPPGATAADISVSRPDLSGPDPSTGRSGGEPVIGPDGRVIAPSEGPKRSTPIDWLLN